MDRFDSMAAGVLPARRWLTLLSVFAAAIAATLTLTALLSAPADAAQPDGRGGGGDNSLSDRLDALEAEVATLTQTVTEQGTEIVALEARVAVFGLPGAPDAGLGRIGDLYLDIAAIDMYGPKDADGWGVPTTLIGAEGVDGAPGADGSDGRTWLTGNGAPDPGIGVDGDLYLDTTADAYYGPKTAGTTWGDPTGLVGPQGEQGIQGIRGPEGPEGSAGTTTTRLVTGNPAYASSGPATSTATCPVGDVLVSGGYKLEPVDPTMAHYITVFTNRPDGANRWTVTAADGLGDGFTLTAHAICASNPA